MRYMLIALIAGCGSPSGTGDAAPRDANGGVDGAADTGAGDGATFDSGTSGDGASGDGASDTSGDAVGDGPACNLSRCEGTVAVDCQRGDRIDCSMFGATCMNFQDPMSGSVTGACTCGTLAAGTGRCLTTSSAVQCVEGRGILRLCPTGTTCRADPITAERWTCRR